MIGVGVIGYGYWGPNLVRNFMEASGSQVVGISDLNPERLRLAKRRYPAVETSTDYQKLLIHPFIDAIVIATPVSTHYQLARDALEADKHVLIEKPLTERPSQAEHLIAEAARRARVLMVDHTFVYTGAVQMMKQMVDSGELGEIYYYDSVRVNLGLFQHDVNVIWDLAVHDLSIMDYVLQEHPIAVSATGMSHIENQPEDIAYVTLFFDSNLIAHIHINWLAPVKVRRTLVGGSRKMIVYDDIEPSEKVKLYDKGIDVIDTSEDVYRMLFNYRTGDMWAPQLDLTEALHTEAIHFLECIGTGNKPVTDGSAGLRVVKIMDAATKSMGARGQLEKLNL